MGGGGRGGRPKHGLKMTHRSIVFGQDCSCIATIERKTWLKLFGITLEEIPNEWDRHFEEMFKKASERMYILRVCKHYGFTVKQ